MCRNGSILTPEAIFVTRKETFNFSAGPSVLPEEVLQQAQEELPNYLEEDNIGITTVAVPDGNGYKYIVYD